MNQLCKEYSKFSTVDMIKVLQITNAQLEKENERLVKRIIDFKNREKKEDAIESSRCKTDAINSEWTNAKFRINDSASKCYQGFYEKEENGRWMGPDCVGCIKIPNLKKGVWYIGVNITDSMSLSILDSLSLSIKSDETVIDAELIRVEKYSEKGQLLTYRFMATGDMEFPTIEFRVAALVSPADTGSNDERKLSIKISELVIGDEDQGS